MPVVPCATALKKISLMEWPSPRRHTAQRWCWTTVLFVVNDREAMDAMCLVAVVFTLLRLEQAHVLLDRGVFVGLSLPSRKIVPIHALLHYFSSTLLPCCLLLVSLSET